MKQLVVVGQLVARIAREGSDILIFASGFKEIEQLSNNFDEKKYQL